MNHSKYVLFLALILSIFGAMPFPLQAASSQWDILRTLKPGRLIRVVANDAKSYQGEFQALSDEGITLRQPTGERTFAQKDVLRVSIPAKKHWIRNTIIGAFIGACVGTPLMYFNRRNGWWNDKIYSSSTWVPPVFTIAGGLAGIGITSAERWHDIYRSLAFWNYGN